MASGIPAEQTILEANLFVTDSKQGCHLNNIKFREVKQSNPYHIFWIKDTDVRGERMKKSGGEGDEEKGQEGKEHQWRAGGECGKVQARIYIGRSWRTATPRTIQRTLFQFFLKILSVIVKSNVYVGDKNICNSHALQKSLLKLHTLQLNMQPNVLKWLSGVIQCVIHQNECFWISDVGQLVFLNNWDSQYRE